MVSKKCLIDSLSVLSRFMKQEDHLSRAGRDGSPRQRGSTHDTLTSDPVGQLQAEVEKDEAEEN